MPAANFGFPKFSLCVTFFDAKESNQRKLLEIVTHESIGAALAVNFGMPG